MNGLNGDIKTYNSNEHTFGALWHGPQCIIALPTTHRVMVTLWYVCNSDARYFVPLHFKSFKECLRACVCKRRSNSNLSMFMNFFCN